MNYSPQDFMALVAQIEGEGGYIDAEPCTGKVINYKIDGRTKHVSTAHCDMHTRVGVPYDSTEAVDLETYAEIVRDGRKQRVRTRIKHPGEASHKMAAAAVCAVDDAVGLWPRYADLMGPGSILPS